MKRTLLLFGLLIPLSMLAASCGFGRTAIILGDAGPAVVYDYWYYPAWGIYYDYDAHVYFYRDGDVWRRAAQLPPRFHGLGRHVIVKSERGRPWARYDDHRAQYPPGHGWRKHHFDDD